MEPLIPIQSVSVIVVAADLADGRARYLDCRSEEEYAAGVVPGSINLPYPHNGNRETIDPEEFLEDVVAEGFQTSEFLLEKGFLDFIVDRRELREKLNQIINMFNK